MRISAAERRRDLHVGAIRPEPTVVFTVSDLARISDDWRRALLRRGLSPATARIYVWAVKTFLKQRPQPSGQVDRAMLEQWQDAIGERLHPRSAQLARTGMHQLLIWAADRDLCDPRLERAIVGIKTEKRYPRPLLPSDLLRIQAHLIEQCDPELAEFFGWSPPRIRDYRDRALFHYFIATGGRVSEVLQVRRASFDRQTVRQKGGTSKDLVCPPNVGGLIHEYLARRTDRLDALWVAFKTDGTVTELHDDGVLKIWARMARRYAVPRFTTHQLRHTSATLLTKLGHDPLVIASHLGHADLRSVQLYAKVAGTKLQSARADLDVA